MRRPLLLACLCVVSWPAPANIDPRFTLDEATGIRWANNSYFQRNSEAPKDIPAPADISTVVADRPTQTDSAIVSLPAEGDRVPATRAAPSIEEIAALIPSGAIEQPVPSGVVINNGENAGIPLPPIPRPVVARSTEEICGSLAYAAQTNDLPAPFFIRLLFQESRFDPAVVSSAGAQGIAQFMPDTASDMGVDNPFDPLQAIPASARLLRGLFQKFGNLGLAAAAYNAGPKRIQDWLQSKGKGKLPEETQGYVKTITGVSVDTWTVANARHPGEKLPRHAPCQETAGLLAWNGPDAVPLPTPSPRRAVAAKPDLKPKPAGAPKSESTAAAGKRKPVKAKPQQIAQR